RLDSRDRVAREHQLHRATHAHQPRMVGAVRRRHRAHGRVADLRILGDVDEIARGREFSSSREAVSVDLRDDWRRHVPHLKPSVDQMARPNSLAWRNVARKRLAGRLRKVIAGAETFAVAANDNRADARIDIGLTQGIEEFGAQTIGKRVALVGTVERDAPNTRLRIVDLDEFVIAHRSLTYFAA